MLSPPSLKLTYPRKISRLPRLVGTRRTRANKHKRDGGGLGFRREAFFVPHLDSRHTHVAISSRFSRSILVAVNRHASTRARTCEHAYTHKRAHIHARTRKHARTGSSTTGYETEPSLSELSWRTCWARWRWPPCSLLPASCPGSRSGGATSLSRPGWYGTGRAAHPHLV